MWALRDTLNGRSCNAMRCNAPVSWQTLFATGELNAAPRDGDQRREADVSRSRWLMMSWRGGLEDKATAE